MTITITSGHGIPPSDHLIKLNFQPTTRGYLAAPSHP
jgi:hypothetical protein